jgi:hypothetical protein
MLIKQLGEIVAAVNPKLVILLVLRGNLREKLGSLKTS